MAYGQPQTVNYPQPQGMAFSSLLGPLLMSFGPAILNKIFGKDPAKEYRQQVTRLTSAQNVGKLTNQFYQQALGSPGYSQAQGAIAAGANATQGNLQAALGARGIGTSGTGAVLSSLIPSIVGSQQAGLRTSAYGMGQQQAQQQIQAQLAALQGTYGQASPTQQMFGAGLDAFAPYLQAYFRSRYPGFGG